MNEAIGKGHFAYYLLLNALTIISIYSIIYLLEGTQHYTFTLSSQLLRLSISTVSGVVILDAESLFGIDLKLAFCSCG